MMTAGSGSFGVTGPLTSWPGDPHANYPMMPAMPQMMMPMQAPTPVPGSAPVIVQSTPAPEPLPEIVGQP